MAEQLYVVAPIGWLGTSSDPYHPSPGIWANLITFGSLKQLKYLRSALNGDMSSSTPRYWLMKAEPDSRVVKGKDVKFSIDDFESVESTPWEGVRNYEARNLMKEMAVGDKVLFYHSNCKSPGIAGFAEVSAEAYPDYTAWDSTHPYFDEKSDKSNPRWFMVDVKFMARARHFIPLSLLRHLAHFVPPELPKALDYVGEDGINAIKAMPLVTRGRLSVQRVSVECWDIIRTMADKGGWDDMLFERKKATKDRHPVDQTRPSASRQSTGGRKRKASEYEEQTPAPHRKSLRRKK